ncbi:MAG: hypothetical protein WDN45_09660 [Caulobacteraceae bacterium]
MRENMQSAVRAANAPRLTPCSTPPTAPARVRSTAFAADAR